MDRRFLADEGLWQPWTRLGVMASTDDKVPRRRGTLFAAIVLLALLALAGYVGWSLWQSLAGTTISNHGLIALALGAVLSLALGGGLMALVFFSSRRGYDEDVGKE
jgi:hypothetical protein